MRFDIHYLFLAKYAKWIIIILISLFSLLIGITYLSFIFSLKESPPVFLGKNMAINNKEQSLNSILNSSFFGVYVPSDLNDDNIKNSMLNVTLVGILLGNPKEESQIIIRFSSGEEHSFKMGDKIPGGALIKSIMSTSVLVEHNGALERLSLPKEDLKFEPVAKPLGTSVKDRS